MLLRRTASGRMTIDFSTFESMSTVFGRDLYETLARNRHEVGVCPQHDVLWDELTCMEHLSIFAALKGAAGIADEAK